MLSEVVKKTNEVKLATLAKNLEKRGTKVSVADDAKEALDLALAFIKPGDKVACGGSMTLGEIGLKDKLPELDIDYIDHSRFTDPADVAAERVRGLGADVYFMSSNAVTMDGVLMNIDGTGNRVAALCYGPKQVVLVIGANKICADEHAAYSRIKTEACTANAVRLGRNTPCAKTGRCADCLNPEATICSMTLTTRFCYTGRLNVILVNESLGY